MELIVTKLAPPIEPKKLIARPRLTALFNEIESKRATLVQTPAGYGKTSLLCQWYQALRERGHRVAWLSLDASDSDAATTLAYLAAAINRGLSAAAGKPFQLAGAEHYLTADLMLNTLINGLAQLSQPIFVFLDDIHLASSGTLGILQRLLDMAPSGTHFVASSRIMPCFKTAKLRATGQLLEVSAEDLVCTTQEAEQILQDAGHDGIIMEELDAINSRTEGWITGLKLAGLAWQPGVPATEFLASFAGTRRAIADFFAEEVLAAQPKEVQEFLIAISVLDRLTPALCDAVTENNNGREILEQIESRGLFLVQLDDERGWFRLHHLFSDFLRRHLHERDRDAEHRVYARASVWFEQHGDPITAINYALKGGDVGRAARILEHQCQDMAYTGRIRVVTQFAKQIPMKVLRQHPTVLLTWAWVLTYNLRFEESEKLLGEVHRHLEELERASKPGEEAATRQLRAILLHREMSLATARDDASKVEELAELVIREYLEDLHPYLRGVVYSLLIYAQREQYKLTDIESLAAKALGCSNRSGYSQSAILYHANVGPALMLAGKVDAAQRTLEQGVEVGTSWGGPSFALAAIPALPLAELLYERNEVEQARLLLADALPVATMFGLVDQLSAAYVTQARLHALDGQLQAAHEILDRGMSIALDRNLERLRLIIIGERIRLLLQHEHSLDRAARYARAAGLPTSPEEVLPRGRVRSGTEAQAIAWVRIAQKQDRTAEAIHVAKQWRSFLAGRGAVRCLIRWNILLAEAQLLGADPRAAQRSLREAIAQAAPLRLVRAFLDEGAIIQTLLENIVEGEASGTSATDLFAAELVAAFRPATQRADAVAIDQQPAEGIYGKLTGKELEILSLVAAGMRNGEVAGKLGMTEGSIKWYLQQIYDKMGTRRRLQAVERARQLGMLA